MEEKLNKEDYEKILKDANELDVPEVIGVGEGEQYAFLILDFVDSVLQQKNFWEAFGSSLAKLHKHSSDAFGLAHDNYIGSLSQSLKRHSS